MFPAAESQEKPGRKNNRDLSAKRKVSFFVEKREFFLRKAKNIYKENTELKKIHEKRGFSLKNQFILLVEKGKK